MDKQHIQLEYVAAVASESAADETCRTTHGGTWTGCLRKTWNVQAFLVRPQRFLYLGCQRSRRRDQTSWSECPDTDSSCRLANFESDLRLDLCSNCRPALGCGHPGQAKLLHERAVILPSMNSPTGLAVLFSHDGSKDDVSKLLVTAWDATSAKWGVHTYD